MRQDWWKNGHGLHFFPVIEFHVDLFLAAGLFSCYFFLNKMWSTHQVSKSEGIGYSEWSSMEFFYPGVWCALRPKIYDEPELQSYSIGSLWSTPYQK